MEITLSKRILEKTEMNGRQRDIIRNTELLGSFYLCPLLLLLVPKDDDVQRSQPGAAQEDPAA